MTSFMNSSSEAEVNSDGLMTTVQPAASAGASFQVVSISGEFHGVMNAHTPTGSLQDVVEVVRPVDRHHRALDLVGQPAVVIEPLGHVLGLRRHLRDQLAVVAHLDLAQVLGVLLDQPGDAAHHLAARGLRHLRPGTGLEGARGGLDRPVDVGLVAFGDQRPGLARVGIEGLEGLAGGGVDPFAVDVGLVVLERGRDGPAWGASGGWFWGRLGLPSRLVPARSAFKRRP